MSSRIEVQAVGTVGERIVYVCFFKEGKPMENQLWKLTHPGNLEVEKWNDSMLEIGEKKTGINRESRTRMFFQNCVTPVKDPIPGVPLEAELVKEYGPNSSPKPDPDRIHPKLYGAWQTLREKFLGGDIWDDIEKFESADIGKPAEAKSQRNSKQ